MDSFSIKVIYNNDTRKITSTVQDLLHDVAERFGLPSSDAFNLLFDGEPVGVSKIAAMAALKPGKAIKYELIDTAQRDVSSDDLEVLKQPVVNAKQAAKAARQQAKAAEKQAKIAEKMAKAAEKAEAKAAARAEKAARKAAAKAEFTAEKNNKSPNNVIPGKLVNWEAKDGVTGELILLPDGRVCFHAEGHPGNLRICKYQQVQRKGGTGEAAQFAAHPTDKHGVFRLVNQASGVFLGVTTSDEHADFPLGSSFAAVESESPDGLWSFYPAGSADMMELQPPAPLPTPTEVYAKLQCFVDWIASNTGVPIHMDAAPEDEEAVVGMLNKLLELLPHGIQRIAMKKTGLRKFELPSEVQPEPKDPEEWDLMVQDLEDMGFESPDANRKAVQAANGDLKKAIKSLMQATRE